jgi:hypothetical protein
MPHVELTGTRYPGSPNCLVNSRRESILDELPRTLYYQLPGLIEDATGGVYAQNEIEVRSLDLSRASSMNTSAITLRVFPDDQHGQWGEDERRRLRDTIDEAVNRQWLPKRERLWEAFPDGAEPRIEVVIGFLNTTGVAYTKEGMRIPWG